jgi:hypothetical protein
MTPPPWHPRHVITPAIARGLMEIEAARAVVDETPLPLSAEAELRRRARLRSTHHSTRIEGNRLVVADPSKRGRSYELSAIYRQYVGGLSAMPEDGK